MVTIIISGFLFSAIAPVIHRYLRKATGWVLAGLAASYAIYFASLLGVVTSGEIIEISHAWVPSLGVSFSFYVDGLSLLFALIISGIGALIFIYAGGYLAGHPQLDRFYTFITLFMTAMLGLVLAGNIITLFIFWELTSITSYLLIGFKNESADSRYAARQALLVTGAGGLALMAGLIMLGQAGGSFELSALLSQGDGIRSSQFYLPILILILAGAFTKSAQFPFHFWLPGAMQAPAPVSAYLHSATMVNAGIYLLARLSSVMGNTPEWHYVVTLFGVITMLFGAILSLLQTDLKRILAYSTIAVLGTLTLLIGLDTTLSMKAAMVFLLVHSLYKGALFLTAGNIEHESGTRDIGQLNGLLRFMPITTVATGLACFSMAGFPPLLGFISKELLYEAKLESSQAGLFVTGAGVLANIFLVAVSGLVCTGPLLGRNLNTPQKPHEAPFNMWLGPIVLAGSGLVIGLFPGAIDKTLIAPAVSAVQAQQTEVKLAIWHGVNPVLLLSIVTVASGVLIYFKRNIVINLFQKLNFLSDFDPARGYNTILKGLDWLAQTQTRLLQSGYLPIYLLIVIATTVSLTGYTLITQFGLRNIAPEPSQLYFHEAVIAFVIMAGVIAAVRSQSRLAAVAALGIVGYSIALLYVFFGAPDLAMTQFAIESLTVILFVFVLYRLPRFTILSRHTSRVRDAVVALIAGCLMSALILAVTSAPLQSVLTPYFAENSLLIAKGRNIVNVILVDFRGLDTLGEITVLAVAAISVYALLKLRLTSDNPPRPLSLREKRSNLPIAGDAHEHETGKRLS